MVYIHIFSCGLFKRLSVDLKRLKEIGHVTSINPYPANVENRVSS
jgi:hypothetical protein